MLRRRANMDLGPESNKELRKQPLVGAQPVHTHIANRAKIDQDPDAAPTQDATMNGQVGRGPVHAAGVAIPHQKRFTQTAKGTERKLPSTVVAAAQVLEDRRLLPEPE